MTSKKVAGSILFFTLVCTTALGREPVGQTPDVILQELIDSIQIGGNSLHVQALERFAPDGGKDAVSVLIHALHSAKNSFEIKYITQALAAYGELAAPAGKDLMQIIMQKTARSYTRGYAAWALGCLGTRGAGVSHLLLALAQKEEDVEVRIALYCAYGRLTGNATRVSGYLIERASRPGNEGIAALRALGSLGEPAVLRGMVIIMRKLRSKGGSYRGINEMSARALTLGGPRAARNAARALKSVYLEPTFGPAARVWAAAGLVEAGVAGDAEITFLLSNFRPAASSRQIDRDAAVEAFRHLVKVKKYEPLVDGLIKVLRQGDTSTGTMARLWGLSILRRMGPPKAAETLFTSLADSTNWEMRYVAMRALEEIAARK